MRCCATRAPYRRLPPILAIPTSTRPPRPGRGCRCGTETSCDPHPQRGIRAGQPPSDSVCRNQSTSCPRSFHSNIPRRPHPVHTLIHRDTKPSLTQPSKPPNVGAVETPGHGVVHKGKVGGGAGPGFRCPVDNLCKPRRHAAPTGARARRRSVTDVGWRSVSSFEGRTLLTGAAIAAPSPIEWHPREDPNRCSPNNQFTEQPVHPTTSNRPANIRSRPAHHTPVHPEQHDLRPRRTRGREVQWRGLLREVQGEAPVRRRRRRQRQGHEDGQGQVLRVRHHVEPHPGQGLSTTQ